MRKHLVLTIGVSVPVLIAVTILLFILNKSDNKIVEQKATPTSIPAETLAKTTQVAFEKISSSHNLNISEYKQKYSLSCEAAAVSAGYNYLKIPTTEDEILAVLPKDETPRKMDSEGNLSWGNPYTGFVGDYDGILNVTGYGIYAKAMQKSLKLIERNSSVIDDASIEKLYEINNTNKPIIVWISSRFQVQEVKYWNSPDGQKIPWIDHEHAVVFEGYDNDLEEIYVMDVLTGTHVTAKKDNFLRSWRYLGNQALVLDN